MIGRPVPETIYEICRNISPRTPPNYARRFVEKIFKAVEKLTDHPKIGRRVPEADRNDVRELIFQNYRIIYLTRPDSIYIVTVIHGSRDLSKQAAKPWEIG